MDRAPSLDLIEEMTEEEFNRWRHDPAGRVLFGFMAAQLEHWRGLAADLVQAGSFNALAERPGQNPHYVGGQMRAFDDLLRITLADIQGFYREASGGEESNGSGATQAD